jgi:vancomycin resistance protein YoaR
MQGDMPRDDTNARERIAARRAQRSGAHRSARIRRGRVVVSALAAVLVALTVIATLGLWLTKDRILPNVSVQGTALVGLTVQEARATLEQRHMNFLRAPLTLRDGERTWTPPAAEIGVSLAIDEAVAQAYAVGRIPDSGNLASGALQLAQTGRDIPLRIVVDTRRLQTYLISVAATVDVAPQNAHVSIVRGQVQLAPARDGRQVLVDRVVEEVIAALAELRPRVITIQTRTLTPSISDGDAAETARAVQTLLDTPLELRAGEQRWTWSARDIGALLHIDRSSSPAVGQQLDVRIDQERVEVLLTEIAGEIDRVPIEPQLRFDGGTVRIVQPGQAGVELDRTMAVRQVEQAIERQQQVVELPLTAVQPQITEATLARLGIVELVAQGKSSFVDSAPYRVTNIIAGARRMDGTLIAPGAEFSFNQTVGAIDETNGFTKGYAIIDGRTQLEWGGGVCQVSTTVFRAAFWAGLPISERNQHSFRIRWYEVFEPVGMDAAIFTGPGGYDLRFVNNTDAYLLMQTTIDTAGQVLTVELYGTRPEREVIQLPPAITGETPAPTRPRYTDDPSLPRGVLKQTDTARGGLDVRVERIVRQNGEVLLRDTFVSSFQPWPDIFVRGTGS